MNGLNYLKNWGSNLWGGNNQQVQEEHQGAVVQLNFIESCAKDLNVQLKSVNDGDVKGVKGILFNASTVTLVATVALYVLGGMTFLGAAALIALSLLGRAVVLKSCESLMIEQSGVAPDSRPSYRAPETFLGVNVYPVFLSMDPIIGVSTRNLPGRNGYNPQVDTHFKLDFRIFRAAPPPPTEPQFFHAVETVL